MVKPIPPAGMFARAARWGIATGALSVIHIVLLVVDRPLYDGLVGDLVGLARNLCAGAMIWWLGRWAGWQDRTLAARRIHGELTVDQARRIAAIVREESE